MTTNELFFALSGLMLTLFGIFMAFFFKGYLDVKIDPIAADLKRLIKHMEERTK